MKILGIGNAIVDVICKVDDKFLKDHKLTKGTMKLVDELEFQILLSNLTIENSIAGGSVANSIVGLAQLGNKAGFIGKVNNDTLGKVYEESLIKEKVNFCYKKKHESIPTGTCLILITPDSERTMCTFLGIAGKVNENDIDENIIKSCDMIFLEGYLWDKGEPKSAFDKAIQFAKKKAMSLSDKFCVDRHKLDFLDLVKNKLDITFANEQEIYALLDTQNFEEVVQFGKSIKKLIVITRSSKGSIAIQGDKVFECQARKNLNIVDLTGAGDLFASGFLHGCINRLTIQASLEQGTLMASKIIQKIGARLN